MKKSCTYIGNFDNRLRIEGFTPNREEKLAPIFAAYPCMSSFKCQEDGSSGPAFVGGALRPTDGVALCSSTRTSEPQFEGEGGDFGDVGPMLDSGTRTRTKKPCADDADHHLEQIFTGTGIQYVLGASVVSDALYTDHSECSGMVSRRRSAQPRCSVGPRRSVET